MIEIIGNELEKAFEELNIKAIKTYQSESPKQWQDIRQVWEMDESEFAKLDILEEKDWKDDWGWWRFAIGSNVCYPFTEGTVNNKPITLWYDEDKLESFIDAFISDYEDLSEEEAREKTIEDFFKTEFEFPDLLTYFCDHIGASTERNVCAVSVDLARINKMKMSELYQRYQG